MTITLHDVEMNHSRPASTADADKDDDETNGETDERDGDDQKNCNIQLQ